VSGSAIAVVYDIHGNVADRLIRSAIDCCGFDRRSEEPMRKSKPFPSYLHMGCGAARATDVALPVLGEEPLSQFRQIATSVTRSSTSRA